MSQTVNNASLLRSLSNQMADAVERIRPAIVLVNGRQRQPATGVVYSTDLVLTANHVLEREENLTIQTDDQRTLAAKVVGRDSATDLAVLRVENLNIQPATPASEQARVGQLTLAVGRGSNDGTAASMGIVSTVGGPLRTNRGVVLERYIRTDATPYPGFSGGPLVDAEGNMLGLLTTGLVDGLALAIPAQIAQTIADTLSKQGFVKRGYFGISSQPIELPASQRAGRTQEHGLLIVRVDENSPAQQGGLLIGDILVSLDGRILNDAEDLQMFLSSDRVGKAIAVEVIRGGAVQTLQVTVGQRS
ncbi:MAG: trypsin-like peptidase domain-containing protein [Ktedonobacteraceae bacterium]